VTGKPIAVLLQSISGVSAINPLVASYDIHGGKREVLFFCPGHHTRTNLLLLLLFFTGTKVTLRMFTIANATVPLTISYSYSPLDEQDGLLYSSILLCILYFLIIFEVSVKG
jgi:hypothetical protein